MTNGQAKITEAIVREIRARDAAGRIAKKFARGMITQRALASEYGLSQAHVFKITKGERWAWLDAK